MGTGSEAGKEIVSSRKFCRRHGGLLRWHNICLNRAKMLYAIEEKYGDAGFKCTVKWIAMVLFLQRA